jgi:hypothetical protein
VADLAAEAQAWVEREFRDPASDGTRYIRRIADEVADAGRILAPRHTGRTAESVHAGERTGSDGVIWYKVTGRNPQTDVLNSKTGRIRNRGKLTHELTRTGKRKRSAGTGRSTRSAHPFLREALFSVEKLM